MRDAWLNYAKARVNEMGTATILAGVSYSVLKSVPEAFAASLIAPIVWEALEKGPIRSIEGMANVIAPIAFNYLYSFFQNSLLTVFPAVIQTTFLLTGLLWAANKLLPSARTAESQPPRAPMGAITYDIGYSALGCMAAYLFLKSDLATLGCGSAAAILVTLLSGHRPSVGAVTGPYAFLAIKELCSQFKPMQHSAPAVAFVVTMNVPFIFNTCFRGRFRDEAQQAAPRARSMSHSHSQ